MVCLVVGGLTVELLLAAVGGAAVAGVVLARRASRTRSQAAEAVRLHGVLLWRQDSLTPWAQVSLPGSGSAYEFSLGEGERFARVQATSPDGVSTVLELSVVHGDRVVASVSFPAGSRATCARLEFQHKPRS